MSTDTTVRSEAARLIQAAVEFGPSIARMRDQIEHERRLPPPLVQQLYDLGFFSLWLARSYGGPEVSLTDFVRIVEMLARWDASVAWCVTNGGGYARFSGFLAEPVARRIFVDDRAVVAGNMGAIGKAVRVSGGYRVSGRWAYASGITHSNWVLGGCVVLDDAGAMPRRLADGAPDTRVVFFPAAATEVVDTWRDRNVLEVRSRLEQQNACRPDAAQPGSDDRAGRSSADDDEVMVRYRDAAA